MEIQKAESIIGADYSEYPNPLRDLLEYRKAIFKHREEFRNIQDFKTEMEYDAVLEYCEDKIKLLLAL
jgi:hypothetical protein